MEPNFEKKVLMRVRNRFHPKQDIGAVLDFVKAQKVPGELVILLPGNGGVTSVEFREKERVLDAEIPAT